MASPGRCSQRSPRGPAGAERLWLEVEDDNAPALALYRALGLERTGGYSYLTAESISRTGS